MYGVHSAIFPLLLFLHLLNGFLEYHHLIFNEPLKRFSNWKIFRLKGWKRWNKVRVVCWRGLTCSTCWGINLHGKRPKARALLDTGKGALKEDDNNRQLTHLRIKENQACKHLSTCFFLSLSLFSYRKIKELSLVSSQVVVARQRETFSFPHLHVQPDVSFVLKARY